MGHLPSCHFLHSNKLAWFDPEICFAYFITCFGRGTICISGGSGLCVCVCVCDNSLRMVSVASPEKLSKEKVQEREERLSLEVGCLVCVILHLKAIAAQHRDLIPGIYQCHNPAPAERRIEEPSRTFG